MMTCASDVKEKEKQKQKQGIDWAENMRWTGDARHTLGFAPSTGRKLCRATGCQALDCPDWA